MNLIFSCVLHLQYRTIVDLFYAWKLDVKFCNKIFFTVLNEWQQLGAEDNDIMTPVLRLRRCRILIGGQSAWNLLSSLRRVWLPEESLTAETHQGFNGTECNQAAAIKASQLSNDALKFLLFSSFINNSLFISWSSVAVGSMQVHKEVFP